jgi:hypothetical protein
MVCHMFTGQVENRVIRLKFQADRPVHTALLTKLYFWRVAEIFKRASAGRGRMHCGNRVKLAGVNVPVKWKCQGHKTRSHGRKLSSLQTAKPPRATWANQVRRLICRPFCIGHLQSSRQGGCHAHVLGGKHRDCLASFVESQSRGSRRSAWA